MLARMADVRKRYGTDEVLRGVSLSVDTGQFVTLVGRSGSGKSSLLHILGGLDRLYDGEVELFGTPMRGLRDGAMSALRNERLGFVFQAFHLLDHMTVAENIWLPVVFHSAFARWTAKE